MSSAFANLVVIPEERPYSCRMARTGADLALLLLGGFRHLADAATAELSRRGFEDVRPAHDFAMRAIAAGADSASELARRLSVSKQAVAKTVASLEERGYVTRVDDPADARRRPLRVTDRGFEAMREGEAIFNDLRERWARQIGEAELTRLEASLAALVGTAPVRLDAPGWSAQDLDTSSR
ncbi:MarR family winged helix-turn-helix transcriptional regulator [Kaistia hirudinis]|nr:MarR family winged helix-turn-helix transcriptional regulator [Kaistia hirudinis]